MAFANKKSINPNSQFVIYKRKDFKNLGHSSKPVYEFADKIIRVLRNNVLSGSSKKDVDALLAMFCRQQISPSEINCFPPNEFHRINSIQRLTDLSEDEQKRYLIQIRDNLRFICHTAETQMKSPDSKKDLKTILSFLYEPEYKGAECFGPFLRFPSAETVFVINGYPVITLYGFVENKTINWEQTFFVIDAPDTSADYVADDVTYNVHNFNDGGDPDPQDEDDEPATGPRPNTRSFAYGESDEFGSADRGAGERSYGGTSSHNGSSSPDSASSAGFSPSSRSAYGSGSSHDNPHFKSSMSRREASDKKDASDMNYPPKKGLEPESGKTSDYDLETDDISRYNTVNTESDPFGDGPSASNSEPKDFNFSGAGGRSDFGDDFRPGDDFAAKNPGAGGDEYSEISPFSQLTEDENRDSNSDGDSLNDNAGADDDNADPASAEYSALNEESNKDAESSETEQPEPVDDPNSKKKNFWFWVLVAILILLLLFLLLWALSFKEPALSFVRFWEPDRSREQVVLPANGSQTSGADPVYVTEGPGADTSGAPNSHGLTGSTTPENGEEDPTGGADGDASVANTPSDGSSRGGTAGAVPQDGGTGSAPQDGGTGSVPQDGASTGVDQSSSVSPISADQPSSASPNSSADSQSAPNDPGAGSQTPSGDAGGAPGEASGNPGDAAPAMSLTEGQSEPSGQNPVFDPTQLSGDKTPFEKLDPGADEDPGQGYEPAAADDPSLGNPPAAGLQPLDDADPYGGDNPQTAGDPAGNGTPSSEDPTASADNPAAGGVPLSGEKPSAGQPSAGGNPSAGQPSAGGNPSAGQPSAGENPSAGQPSANGTSQSSKSSQTTDGASAAQPAQSDNPAKKPNASLYFSNEYRYIRIRGQGDTDVLQLKHKTDSTKNCATTMARISNTRTYVMGKAYCANSQYVPSKLVCAIPSGGYSMCTFIDSRNVETPFYIKLEEE